MSRGMSWARRLMPASVLLLLLLLLVTVGPRPADAHGRLMEPPARNAMWRFGFPNPVNYNDNELFCGGYAVQWEQNQGNCGVCGDAYHLRAPRPHEAGGEYGKGIVSRRYVAGQELEVEIELTANHMGRFELYLCPNNNPRAEATQDCFDRYPLYLSGTREVRFFIPPDSKKKDVFRYRVQLPLYVSCTQCVLQWTYFTGNMWGRCDNGTESPTTPVAGPGAPVGAAVADFCPSGWRCTSSRASYFSTSSRYGLVGPAHSLSARSRLSGFVGSICNGEGKGKEEREREREREKEITSSLVCVRFTFRVDSNSLFDVFFTFSLFLSSTLCFTNERIKSN
uniref:Chitin-binding type-4 domain-containing protein n=1 Tax=Anopheles coluzzii TaxID=1518534 RepID=A0A8W7PYY1_ANOCL